MSGHAHKSEHHSSPVDASAGYEKTDAKAKPIIVFTLIMTVFTAACFLISVLIYKVLETGQAAMDPGTHPLAAERKIPEAAPRLQLAEAADLKIYREEQDQKVHGYAWVQRESSVARIPVDRAMDLVLKNHELKSRE